MGRIIDKFEELVSPYSIITDISINKPQTRGYPFYLATSTLGCLKTHNRLVMSWLSGVGISEEQALAAILGESVERYAWINPSRQNTIFTSLSNLNEDRCEYQDSGLLFRKDINSYELENILKTKKTPWTLASSLTHDRKVYIPTPDLFQEDLPFNLHDQIMSTTNGLAAHVDHENACLNAIYEIIERDSIMRTWYDKEQPQAIWSLNNLGNSIDKLLCNAYEKKIDVVALKIKSKIDVSSVIAYVYNKDAKGYIYFGASCNYNSKKATIKAILEASSLWTSIESAVTKEYLRDKKINDKNNLKDFVDHVLFYTNSKTKPGYEFLLPNKSSKVIEHHTKHRSLTVKDELDLILKRLKHKGFEVFLLDITPKDVKSLDLVVVKVVIPGFIPLFVGNYRPHNTLLSKMKMTNNWAHPFP